MESGDKKKIIELRKQGFTIRAIKDTLNIKSTNTVFYYLEKEYFKFKSIAEIKNENRELRKEKKLLENKIKKIQDLIS